MWHRPLPNVHPWIVRLAQLTLWLLIAVVAIPAGLHLRDWTWTATKPIRFHGDIANAVAVGSRTFDPPAAAPRADDPKRVDWPKVLQAYLTRYDRERDRIARAGHLNDVHDINYTFDYPPGRLLIATVWTAPVFVERGIGTRYDDSFAGPMLAVNTAHELAAAIGVFLLVRLTFRRSGRGNFVSEAGGMAAALLTWFNPAGLMDGHGWPQWDLWVVPYTIWATYFALGNRWLMAGLLLALGAMFKGQVLMLAPLFLVWPIVRLDASALLRLLAGFGATVAVLMSPWLLRASPAQIWAIGATLLAVPVIACPRRWRFGSLWGVATAALVGWTLGPLVNPVPGPPLLWHAVLFAVAMLPLEYVRGWPLRLWSIPRMAIVCKLASAAPAWLLGSLAVRWPTWFALPTPTAQSSLHLTIAALLLVAIVATLSAIWRGRRAMWLAIFICGIVALAAVQYDGSMTWLTVGFQTDRWHAMAVGRAANLPAILATYYGLNVDTPISLFGYLSAEQEWTLRTLLRGIATVGVALCGAAIAVQQWRRDANLLIAVPAAWAIIFAFTPQMHERYLIWAAVTSSVLITRGIGGLLIYAVFSTMQFAALYVQMCEVQGRGLTLLRDPWWRAAAGLQPSAGYIALTLAVVLLVWSFRRSAPPRALVAQPV